MADKTPYHIPPHHERHMLWKPPGGMAKTKPHGRKDSAHGKRTARMAAWQHTYQALLLFLSETG